MPVCGPCRRPPAGAETAGIIAVRGIDVDVTAGNAVDAREKAVLQGQRKGLRQALLMLAPIGRCRPAWRRSATARSPIWWRITRSNPNRPPPCAISASLPSAIGRTASSTSAAAERGLRQRGAEPAGIGAADAGCRQQEPAVGRRQFLAHGLVDPSALRRAGRAEASQGRCNRCGGDHRRSGREPGDAGQAAGACRPIRRRRCRRWRSCSPILPARLPSA